MKRDRRRLVDIENDPFIDLAFVLPLIKNEAWLRVVKTQAEEYAVTGNLGLNSVTYKTYEKEVRDFTIKIFKKTYNKVDEWLDEETAKIKAEKAWKALITLFTSQYLMKKTGVWPGDLLPETYSQPAELVNVIEALIAEKTKTKGVPGTFAVSRALRMFDSNRHTEIAPLLWWINLVMESEAFEGIFRYHILASGRWVREYAEKIESTALSIIRGYRSDLEYTEYEIMRALLSRFAELRGQYINKLQNAVLFVKYLRKSVKNPEHWTWFLRDETLTYIMTMYLAELQHLSGMKQIELNISSLIAPAKEVYGRPPSALVSLILLSPIFMQYAIEARKEIIITPADILVALARQAKSAGEEDFAVGVDELAESIIKFWEERDILRRLRIRTGEETRSETLYTKSSFTASLALLTETGIGTGIVVLTRRKPVLRLPPRMFGFDSLFVRTSVFLSALSRLWGG